MSGIFPPFYHRRGNFIKFYLFLIFLACGPWNKHVRWRHWLEGGSGWNQEELPWGAHVFVRCPSAGSHGCPHQLLSLHLLGLHPHSSNCSLSSHAHWLQNCSVFFFPPSWSIRGNKFIPEFLKPETNIHKEERKKKKWAVSKEEILF